MFKLHRRDLLKGALASGLMLPAGRILAQDSAAVLEAARKEGKVALATSVSAANFPTFLEAFSKKYPFIDITQGLYQAPTGTVLSRVDAEIKAGALSFDVLHVGNQAAYLSYARQGLLLPYASPEQTAFPATAHDRDLWTTVRAVGVLMAYNKNNLAPDKAPKSWADLLKPEFAGKKLVIQNAASGTAFNQMYDLEKTLGADFMKKLGGQEVIITTTAASQLDMLIRGEALVAAGIDHTVVFTDAASKAGIVAVYPTEGVPLAAVPVAILKGAPHPNAARVLVDYMLSKEGQAVLVIDVLKNYSLRSDVPPLPDQKSLSEVKGLSPTDFADFEKALANFPEHFDSFFKKS